MIDIDLVKNYLQLFQNKVCDSLEILDGKSAFISDNWERDGGGGGESRILNNGAIFEKAGVTGEYLQKRLAEFSDHPLVGEVRGSGLIGALELVANKETGEPFVGGTVGGYAQKMAQDNGLLIRAVAGSSLGFCPPLIITEVQIDEMIAKVDSALNQTYIHCQKHGLLV